MLGREAKVLKLAAKSVVAFCLVYSLLLNTSCAPSLRSRIKAMQEAVNRGDVDASASFYAEDARFLINGKPRIEGREAIRKSNEQEAALNMHITSTDCRQSGNAVTCKVKMTNDWLRAAGVSATYYENVRYTFENDLIKEIDARPAQETEKLMQEFQRDFPTWASEKRPQEWAQLREEGITTENVGRWLALVRQWREETKK